MASADVISSSPAQATACASSSKPKAKAISLDEFNAYVNDPRLNRTFQLPADPSRGRLQPFQVSYADFGFHREDGHDDDGEERVLLFFGPLMSSRLFNSVKDELAKQYKVRILTAERPGIGKTDDMPAEKLLEIWRGESSDPDLFL